MKDKKEFVCNVCGYQSARWIGKCPSCGSWDSFTEHIIRISSKNDSSKKNFNVPIVKLNEIPQDDNYRIKLSNQELNRVLGGGIIPGSVILMAGDPGIGKSTLMLQMCSELIDFNPLYITGEESLQQIKYRSARLNGIPENLMLIAETNVETIISAIKSSNCGVAIIDSIQSIYSDRIQATPGTIAQVRESAMMLMQTAKENNIPIFLIGHVTKDGIIAGPKLLEHLVDTVLQFEGEKTYSYRILRALKNRYGSTNEIGIFEMTESGLSEVKNPSELFLVHRSTEEPGIAISAAIEGTRPLLLEVQALVTPTNYGMPQRTSNGYDLRRLQMILAVLEKRLGLMFKQYDVFINIAGGLYVSDPSIDLGIAAALVSSFRDKPIDKGVVLVGEIGLTGEVRQVSNLEQRINETLKLGFLKIFLPSSGMKDFNFKNENIMLYPVEKVSLAINDLF
ncbi:MAG: DNA repair protein RadA [Candidatus Kapabacteria bacterium]|nr:DNA repair protein RadA [Candidatus Kapabacteria bacterium]